MAINGHSTIIVYDRVITFLALLAEGRKSLCHGVVSVVRPSVRACVRPLDFFLFTR